MSYLESEKATGYPVKQASDSTGQARTAMKEAPSRAEEKTRNGEGMVPAALRQVWRMIILVVGGTVLAVGIAMIVLPGPAIVVIPAGLAILATEFLWARRVLERVKARIGFERFRRRVGR